MNLWTDDKVALLKTYLELGMTRRQIATKMNLSYDSVCHAIVRYGLQECKPVSVKSKKVVEQIDLAQLSEDQFEDLKRQAKLNWKIAKTKVPANKNKGFKIGLALFDCHVPHQNDPAIKAILKFMDDVRCDIHINGGDFLDYGCISHWNKTNHKTLEMQRLKKDYIAGNAILDEIDKRLPKGCEKHFFKGNHEVWIDDLLEQTPQLEGLIEPESQLYLGERGYKVYAYNDVVPFGKLHVTHGIYASSNSVKKHLDELKVNIMFGHTHTIAMMLSSSPAREIAFSGYNVGCLCDLSPDYMRGRPHGWSHGFAVVYFYPNGYFEVNLVRIIDGKFIFNNKVYDGNR